MSQKDDSNDLDQDLELDADGYYDEEDLEALEDFDVGFLEEEDFAE